MIFFNKLVGKSAAIAVLFLMIGVNVLFAQSKGAVLKGAVVDDKNVPVAGAVVIIVGTTQGAITDKDGRYEVKIPDGKDLVLNFSFLGFKPQDIPYTGQKELNVKFVQDVAAIDDVVVVGYFSRKTESFTGSASTFTPKEMKTTGTQNILQALGTLDPSFKMAPNNLFGSDPNRMPDIEVRGKTSIVGVKEQYTLDPNQPLFILDGFEVAMQVINDLNMERVASITILKDAASTAIYGSRAANGVVVIETKRPEAGALSVTYTGDFSVAMPALADYNLMNASEKLRFEKLAGVYTSMPHVANDPNYQYLLDKTYNDRFYNVASGVDTYWLKEPVRTGFSNKHNIYAEGGDESMRYGLGLSNNSVNGVMKGSERDAFSGNVDLLYRKNSFSFSNKLTVDNLVTENPIVPFSDYANASPYYPRVGNNGKLLPMLEEKESSNSSKQNIYNPSHQAQLRNKDKAKNFGVRNNFQAEWKITETFRLKGRFGVSKNNTISEYILSPLHKSFAEKTDPAELGSYQKSVSELFSYDGDITISYGKVFKEKHRVNFVGGWTFSESQFTNESFTATGFPSDDIVNPSFTNQYLKNGKPEYSHGLSRATSFFGNLGYSYDDRYLIDANLRVDGSSVFGSDKMFTTTWSVGLSWNLHKEEFLKGNDFFNIVKLRGSIGNPGNLNFDGYNSFTNYLYNTTFSSYHGLGAVVSQWGNPDLQWQKTLDLNVGLDLAMLKNKLKVNVDVFRKLTDPLLVVSTAPSSTGKTTFTTNLGQQLTGGINASIYYTPIALHDKEFVWTLTANTSILRSEYQKIGNALDYLNESQRGSSLSRFYDGGSPSSIWAVQSRGIDPMSGREVYQKKDGSFTFDYDYNDEVVVGNTQPKAEGVFGTTLNYKGFTFSAFFRYRLGGHLFNEALYNKVENVTRENWTNNMDKRALYDRWQTPGNQATFKGIGLVDQIDPASSRFVQKENTLSGEAFSLGYQFIDQLWLKKIACRTLSIRANMSEVFRISSVKAERGIDYPFAKTISLSISATF